MSDPLIWDAPFIGGGMTDSVCDFVAVTLEAGRPDEHGLVEAGTATITLDNQSGEYSLRDVDGRLTFWALGRKVAIWADQDGQGWWLFCGRITAWLENTDNTVTITAHDGFAQLAEEAGAAWTPGTAGQTVAQRITSIATIWHYADPTDLETTPLLLAAPATERSALEEMQVAALSDGGFLFCDADGQLTYRGRTFTNPGPGFGAYTTFSDNICEAHVVWELEVIVDDVPLASTVRLRNWETPTPKTATATATPGPWDRPFTFTHPDPDLWSSQADGDALAADLLARYRNDSPRYSWEMHLRDPNQQLWRAGIDLRLGDRVTVYREQPSSGGETIINTDVLVTTIEHEITPESWLVIVETSRVIYFRYPELWDRTVLAWDSDDPLAVWRT